jgi:hypothetical protein
MFCEQCGGQLTEDARFCARCGAPVREVAPATPPPSTPLASTPPPGTIAPPPTVAPPPPPPPSAGWATPSGASGYASPTKTNGLAIASMVLGILWLYWIGSILALVFGYVAKSQIKRSNGAQTGRGMAIAGIVLGWVGVGLLAIVILVAIVDST